MVLYTVKKCYLSPLYFAQKCPQNVGNAVSETQNSKISRGSCLRTPLQKCIVTLPRGSTDPFPPEMARPLNGSQSKPAITTINIREL